MKKILGMVLTAICVLAFSAPSYALFIANINPFWGGSYDGTSLTGTARVDIFTSFDFDAARLNIGQSSGISSFSGLALITPTIAENWSIASGPGLIGLDAIGTSSPATTTQHLAFTFDFTLTESLNQMAADVAAGGAWSDFFSSGAPWSLNGNVSLSGVPGSFSTTLVPEPATLILLGSGLLGAGVLNRKKRKGEKV